MHKSIVSANNAKLYALKDLSFGTYPRLIILKKKERIEVFKKDVFN